MCWRGGVRRCDAVSRVGRRKSGRGARAADGRSHRHDAIARARFTASRRAGQRSHLGVGQAALLDHLNDLGVERAPHRNRQLEGSCRS